MKKIFGFSAMLAVLLACNPPGKELVGEWKIKEVKEMKDLFENMEPDKRDAALKLMEAQMADNKLLFEQDGSLTTTNSDGSRKGTWELSDDRRILVVKQGNIDSFEVLSVSPSEMTIHGINSSSEENFTMVLERIQP